MTASWITPATSNATASGIADVTTSPAAITGRAIAPPIKHRLKNTGMMAPAAKWSCALAIADHKATSEINGRYGMVIRPSATAASKRSGVATNPGASNRTRSTMKNSASTTITSNTSVSRICTSAASFIAALLPSAARICEKLGTKALVKAPSALSRRNILGNFNATRNASASGPAPRKVAKATSRPKPRIRLNPVSSPICRNAPDSERWLMPHPHFLRPRF